MSTELLELLNKTAEGMSISDLRLLKSEVNALLDAQIAQAVATHNNKLTSVLTRNRFIIEAHLNGDKTKKIAQQFELEIVQVNRIIDRYKLNFIRSMSDQGVQLHRNNLEPQVITPAVRDEFIAFCSNYFNYINQYARSNTQLTVPASDLDMHIEDCELPLYIRKNLMAQGYHNLAEIAILNTKELNAIPNLGRKAVKTIEEFLRPTEVPSWTN